jgi:hypothetical protein
VSDVTVNGRDPWDGYPDAPVAKASSNGSKANMTELGRTGLQQHTGRIQDDILAALQGDKARKVFQEMSENDGIVNAILFGIDMLLRKIEWEVEPHKTKVKKTSVRYRAKPTMVDQPNPEHPASLGLAGPSSDPLTPHDDAHDDPEHPEHPDNKFPPTQVPGVEHEPEEFENEVEEITEEAQAAADFVNECMRDMSMSWTDTISLAMSMLPFGWCYTEVVYKKRKGGDPDDKDFSFFDDGKIGWKKFALRHQSTLYKWEIDDEGGIDGMWQFVSGQMQAPVFIPITKALLFRTTAVKGNPEGRSVLRGAYRAWMFKKRIEEIEAIGAERDLAGLPIAYVPAQMLADTATDAEQAAVNAIKDIVRNIKNDEQAGIVFPRAYDPETRQPVYELSLLSTGGRRQFDTESIIKRKNQEIAMTVLADFILLGHEAVGSYALGGGKINLFQLALQAWAQSIADVFNQFAVPRLLKVNSMDVKLAPKLVPKPIEDIDIAKLGAYFQQLAQAGAPIFPDETLEGWLRNQVGAPPKEEGGGVPDAPPMPMGVPGAGPGAPGAPGAGGPPGAGSPFAPTNGNKPAPGANGLGGNNGGGGATRGANKKPAGAKTTSATRKSFFRRAFEGGDT